MSDLKQGALKAKIAALKLRIRIVKTFLFSKKSKRAYLFKMQFILLDYTSRYQNAVFRDTFGPYAKGVLFSTGNGEIIGCPADVEINRRLGFSGEYDFQKLTYLRKLVDVDSVIYFLGAHIGTLLVPLSESASRVVGFEANPDTFEYLQYNISLNNLSNTSIYNCGVYDRAGSLSFYKNKANSGGSKIKPQKDSFIYNYDNPSELSIKTVCLDDFVITNQLPLPDLMIVDIEGSEYPALKMSQKCLSNCKHLYIEFVPHHLSDVANIDLDTFLSVILPFFNKMTIVGFSDRIFKGHEIKGVLESLYSNRMCVDLLFIK